MTTYEYVLRKAEVDAQEAEQWKVDHDCAMGAWKLNALYRSVVDVLQSVSELDALAEPTPEADAEVRARVLTLMERVCREHLRPFAEQVRPEDYGYSATADRIGQLADMFRAVRRGARFLDREATQKAHDAYERGEVLTLGGLRERLRNRHP